MKRSFPIIFAFVLVISIFFIMMQKDKAYNPAADAVEKVFSETGAVKVASEIYVRGSSKRKVLDRNDARNLLKDIVNGAGALYSKDVPVFKTVDNDYTEGIEINYIIDENKTIQLCVSNETKKDADKSSLTISFTDTSRSPSVKANAAAIQDSLDKYGIEYDTNISLTGSVDGRLEEDELKELYIRAFKTIGADRVEGINDNGLVSVSAFSPSISEAVRVNGKRVNINMAARYNSYEGRTYIWLATPVITTEY